MDGCRCREIERDMPNRGPVELSLGDVDALTAELPPPRDLSEAEDSEDRQRIKLMTTIHGRLAETRATLQNPEDLGTVIFSIDEIDEILDNLPPPPALAAVRAKLGDLQQRVRGGE